MKKVFAKICVCVLVAALVGAVMGCRGGEAETPAGTEAGAASSQDAEGAAAVQANLVYGVAPAPAEGKTAEDYAFAFSFGGINPYSDPCEGAANQMADLLMIPHIEVKTPQDWVQNEQNVILDGLISKGKKGIFMMPSEPTAGNEQISKMVDAGIPVVCIGGAPALPSKATLTLATDVYQSAYIGTEALIEAIGGQGSILALSGALNDTNTAKRFQAVEDACKKHGVTLFQKIGDVDQAEASMTAVGDFLAANGDKIDGIISTAYYPTVAIANYLARDEYKHIKGIGIDTDAKVMEAIKAGTLHGTMSQNPWGQAYISTLTLKMLVDRWTYKEGQPEVIDSGSFLITQENVDSYEALSKEVTEKLLADWISRFNPPQ